MASNALAESDPRSPCFGGAKFDGTFGGTLVRWKPDQPAQPAGPERVLLLLSIQTGSCRKSVRGRPMTRIDGPSSDSQSANFSFWMRISVQFSASENSKGQGHAETNSLHHCGRIVCLDWQSDNFRRGSKPPLTATATVRLSLAWSGLECWLPPPKPRTELGLLQSIYGTQFDADFENARLPSWPTPIWLPH